MFTSNVLTTLPKLNCGQTKVINLLLYLPQIYTKNHHICYNVVGLQKLSISFTNNMA